MNILQLTDYLPEYPGNFGHTLIAIAKYQSERNGICIISFPEPRGWHEKIQHAGGRLLYLPVFKFKEKKFDQKTISQLNKIIKYNNINIVHVHFGLYQKILSIIMKILNPKIKIIWHWRGDVQGKIAFHKKALIFLFYRVFADPFVRAHIANSRHIYNRLKEKHLTNTNKLFSLHNSIQTRLFKKSLYLGEIENISKKYKTNTLFTLIMIRNFRRRVDFDIILDTMEYLKDKEQDIQLLWIGYGETQSEIQKKARSRNLQNIVFLGEINNPIPYYYVSNINIIAWEPWCKESINNTVYEALACELPVVGLHVGGLPIAFDETEGVYTVPLNPIHYAEKILFIKEHYPELHQAVLKGKRKVLENYSLKRYVENLNNIYEKVVYN
ncbi:MAG: glycosyltransferase family 4 protein [Bacteroidales bacterium]